MSLSAAHPMPARRPRRVVVRLWLPVFLLWILLAPLALLALPLLAVILMPRRVDPFAALAAGAAILFALSGTLVEVEAPEASIRLRLI